MSAMPKISEQELTQVLQTFFSVVKKQYDESMVEELRGIFESTIRKHRGKISLEAEVALMHAYLDAK